MKKIILFVGAVLALAAPGWGGYSTDNLVATVSLTAPHSATPPPSQCASDGDRGKIYVDTNAPSGQQLYACEGSSGWKLQGAAAAGGAVAIDTGTVNQLPANRIAAGALGPSVVSSSQAVGSVGNAQLGALAVTAAKIANNTITDTQMAAGTFTNVTVPAANVAAGSLGPSVLSSSVAVNAVGSAQIAALAVAAADIANNTITNTQMAAGTFSNVTVPAANVAAGTLGPLVIASSVGVSGVTAGTYGSATQVSSVTIGADGRVTGAANVAIAISGSSVSGGTFGAINGSALTALNASNLGSGTVPNARIDSSSVTLLGPSIDLSGAEATGILADARFPATLPAASGTNLTSLNATQLTSGSVPNARLDSSSVTLLGPSIDLSGAEATGALAAGRFPALTGDVTTVAGALATTIANVPSSAIATSSVTKQGNTFNGASQLVQLNGSSQLPAVSGVLLTGVSSVTASVFQTGISAGSNVTITNTGAGVQIAASGGTGASLSSTQTFSGGDTFTSSVTLQGPLVDSSGSHGSQVSGLNGLQVLASSSTGLAPLWQTINVVISTAGTSLSGTATTNVCNLAAAAGTQLIAWDINCAQTSTASSQMKVIVTYSDGTTSTSTTGATQASYIIGNSGGLNRFTTSSGWVETVALSLKSVTSLRIETAGAGVGTRGGSISAIQVPM